MLALLSGGRDSVCLLHTLRAGGDPIEALHVNYGLRPEADADEAFCRALCDRLGVTLHVHRAGAPEGNVQDWARQLRYAVAHELTDGDIATGHTATDQVETVLYRLAASPGRRALLGMRARQGRIVRPLLHMTREDTAAYCRAHGLDWVEDASNADLVYARSRVRANVVPALREVHPAAEANVLATVAILRAEAEVLDGLVADVLASRDALPAAELAALHPALRRLVFIALAGAPVGHRVEEVLALDHGAVDVGYGRRATVTNGVIRVDSLPS
jgi:tRNA(Ile)-lysidine synthase